MTSSNRLSAAKASQVIKPRKVLTFFGLHLRYCGMERDMIGLDQISQMEFATFRAGQFKGKSKHFPTRQAEMDTLVIASDYLQQS